MEVCGCDSPDLRYFYPVVTVHTQFITSNENNMNSYSCPQHMSAVSDSGIDIDLELGP